jgi:UDP-N-acetyl-D-glucosamine dehydrogenase
MTSLQRSHTQINSSMPRYVARRIQDLLNDAGKAVRGSNILLLGVTYKANIADERESPAVPLAKRLGDMGAKISYHDPHVPAWGPEEGQRIERVPDLDAALASADLTVLLQTHQEYDPDYLTKTARLLFDTRGVTHSDQVARL